MEGVVSSSEGEGVGDESPWGRVSETRMSCLRGIAKEVMGPKVT